MYKVEFTHNLAVRALAGSRIEAIKIAMHKTGYQFKPDQIKALWVPNPQKGHDSDMIRLSDEALQHYLASLTSPKRASVSRSLRRAYWISKKHSRAATG